MIYTLVFIIILVVFISIIWNNKPLNRRGEIVYLFLAVIIALYSGFRDGNLVKDYDVYEWMHNDEVFIVEPTFTAISYIVRYVFSDLVIFLFLIYAIIGVWLKFVAIKQLTSLFFLSILIYLSDFFILQELVQMRASIATGFLLLSIKPLKERDGKKFLLFSFCATMFHISAIVMFLLWWLNPDKIKKSNWIFFVLIAYCFAIVRIDLFGLVAYIPISQIQERVISYIKMQENGDSGANIFSLLFLAKLIITLFLLWKVELIAKYNKYIYLLLKIMFISIISLLLFSTNLAAGLRFNELFGIVSIILFPMIYYTVKQKYMAWIILVLIAAVLFYIRVYKFELILFS